MPDSADKVYNELETLTNQLTTLINSLNASLQPPWNDVLTLLHCINILLHQAVQYFA